MRAFAFAYLLAAALGASCTCGVVTIGGGTGDGGYDAAVAVPDGSVADGGGDGDGGPLEGGCGDAVCAGAETCGTCAVDCGKCPCPVDAGVDGVGVCSAWALETWDSTCTDGYTRTRTCDTAYDCRVSDHNGCGSPLNIGGAPPGGCVTCGGGGAGTLQYFGYWRDSDIQNFVCQIQDHVSFSMTSDTQGIVDAAASYGVANFGLLAPTSGTPAPLQAVVVRDDADAAAWGWCSANPCPGGIADGWAAVKAQAEAEGDTLRASHPNAHVMINLADGNADGVLDFQGIPGFTLPRGVDWVGLECYTGATGCQANLNVLRPLLPAGSRAWVLTAATSGYGNEAWLVADAQAMYDWTKADSAVIGLMAFVWSKSILCPPDCNALAVKEMPTLLAKYREIGDLITGRGGVAPKADSDCPTP